MTFMRQKQIIFDLDSRTIGFVPANCSHDHNEIILPPPVNNKTKENEQNTSKQQSYKWLMLGIALGGLALLLLVVLIIRRCRRSSTNVSAVRSYANLDLKSPPESVVVLQSGTEKETNKPVVENNNK